MAGGCGAGREIQCFWKAVPSAGFTLLVQCTEFVIGVWGESVAISVISTGYLRREPLWPERLQMSLTEETRLAGRLSGPLLPPGLSRAGALSPQPPEGAVGEAAVLPAAAGGGASPAAAAASAIANPEGALQLLGVFAGPARPCSPWR